MANVQLKSLQDCYSCHHLKGRNNG